MKTKEALKEVERVIAQQRVRVAKRMAHDSNVVYWADLVLLETETKLAAALTELGKRGET